MPRTSPEHPVVAAQFVALLFAALALAGCGTTTPGIGGGEQAGAGRATPGYDRGEQSGGGQNQLGGEQDQGAQDRGERKVGWVPPGPGTGNYNRYGPSTSDADWYRAFNDRNCGAIAGLGPQRGQVQLYTGLGAACRAALGNDGQSWPAAEAALQQLADPADCFDQSALRLLRDLVTVHRQAPDSTIRIVDAPTGARCAADDPTASPTPTPDTEEPHDPTTPTSTTPSSTAPSSSTG